jgi:signal transduction histidine kinase
MATRLESSSAEIAKWNAHLAEEIEAKTKELEKLMAGKVQSERLSAMGYIAASVAHELNDPLTAISGYAQLGLKDTEKYRPPEETASAMKNASEYFRNIEKELQRSKNIIRKLISFVRYSKTTNGAVDVNQVVGDTLGIAKHHLEINKVELFTQLQPSLPPVRGDARQLQQVFLNMVLNAQKAMPNGGKLNVETKQ